MMAIETTLQITKISPEYWRATLCNPPLNLFSPQMYAELRLLLADLENDTQVRVIVFDSSVPDYFCAHYDILRGSDVPQVPGFVPLGQDWPSFVHRMNHLGVVSIASIRGRARGMGSEFALACDIRFASKEKAIFGQPEVGSGMTPGCGGIEWLTALCGRSRALEVILGSDDLDGPTAELYGYINRSIPDAELNQFVDTFARRIAGFDKFPLVNAKKTVNRLAGLPYYADLHESQQLFLQCTTKPETIQRVKKLLAAGLQEDGEGERSLGFTLSQITLD